MTISARPFAACSGLTTALLVGLLLTGCATHETTRSTRTTTTVRDAAPAARHDTPRAATASTSSADKGTRHSTGASATNLPDRTGIPACDDYLASYVGCHRAADIFAPGQLQDRYEAMRTSLLRDSQNPDIRPQLAARCNSLATQLRTALHGKSCEVSPAPASTTP